MSPRNLALALPIAALAAAAISGCSSRAARAPESKYVEWDHDSGAERRRLAQEILDDSADRYRLPLIFVGTDSDFERLREGDLGTVLRSHYLPRPVYTLPRSRDRDETIRKLGVTVTPAVLIFDRRANLLKELREPTDAELLRTLLRYVEP